jgi:hypothetical protein
MRCKALAPEAKAIYGYLSCFAGENNVCWPSIELMQQELGMGKTRLAKYMNQLVAAGVIEKNRQKKGNLFCGNQYKLTHRVNAESRQVDFREVERRAVENRAHNYNSLNKNITVIELFNSICNSFKEAHLTQRREKEIEARFNEGCGLEDFERLFRKAEESDFLKGRNKSGWQASFDWLIKRENMKKVLSGKYRNQERTDANAKQRNFKENTEKSYSFQCWE